ncbi:hypothetical protein C1645_840115 [Glomus cerebriforme]|uniref:Uncharacterized protein n=1 Tax=Glomus cerebriforme TaxID=658196 RepID=A0A397S4P6_9GLOM|nr:hypothetical protein C1645_840115 [Glomus cerebriforme]
MTEIIIDLRLQQEEMDLTGMERDEIIAEEKVQRWTAELRRRDAEFEHVINNIERLTEEQTIQQGNDMLRSRNVRERVQGIEQEWQRRTRLLFTNDQRMQVETAEEIIKQRDQYIQYVMKYEKTIQEDKYFLGKETK